MAQAAQFMLNGTLNAFLPLYAREAAGLSSVDVGWLFGLQVLTTLAIRPAIGAASDRLGRRGVIVTGLAICSTAVFVVSIAETFQALLPAVLMYAAGVAVTTAATSAYITDIAHRARYGTAHGVFGTIYDVGDAAGPILAGLLVSIWGYAPMFRFMALMSLITALTFYVVTRARPATA
jgi:MFS family permease